MCVHTVCTSLQFKIARPTFTKDVLYVRQFKTLLAGIAIIVSSWLVMPKVHLSW